ncbi:MAG: class II aldolase/adducin family protein [Candidatus Omnitrophica bacterium]|nr:class II aldolase/adducin family protein [Candidatus Omnitrophota bacterium]
MEKKILRELVMVSRQIAAAGLVVGSSGNISCRHGPYMYIKRSGLWLERAKISDFIAMDIKTKTVAGKSSRRPSCEFPLHAACYQAREDIHWVVHTHPLYITALMQAGVRLRWQGFEAAMILGDSPAEVAFFSPGSEALAEQVARAAAVHPVVCLQVHGLVTVGAGAAEALHRSLLAERMAQMQLLSLQAQRAISSV